MTDSTPKFVREEMEYVLSIVETVIKRTTEPSRWGHKKGDSTIRLLAIIKDKATMCINQIKLLKDGK